MTSSTLSIDLTIGATVLVAVGGWWVAQWQTRRGLRRTMRVQYLLDAYRRLDDASNRDLDSAHTKDLESAIADIQLLGNPRQVELAQTFARDFAADSKAPTDLLLDELRLALRRELLLERVPPERTSLRITNDGPEARSGGDIRHVVTESIKTNLQHQTHSGFAATPPLDGFLAEMKVLADRSPSAAVVAADQHVSQEVAELLQASGDTEFAGLNGPQLAERAALRGLVDPQTAESISGLSVLHMLDAMKQDDLSMAEAAQFVTLAASILHVLRTSSAHRPTGPSEFPHT